MEQIENHIGGKYYILTNSPIAGMNGLIAGMSGAEDVLLHYHGYAEMHRHIQSKTQDFASTIVFSSSKATASKDEIRSTTLDKR